MTPIEERPIEVIEEEAHVGERVPVEEDVDRLRLQAFQGQEWTTKHFGISEAAGNEYRVSLKGQHYYVETTTKTPGTPNAYGYVGIMVHERDLYNLVTVLVQAVRAKQAKEKGNSNAAE